MMNSELMKHFRIRNRASVREIMLQHEKTFKEQVHDLHKLYEVQRVLMEKAKSNGLDVYVGVTGNLKAEPSRSGQQRNFWEQIRQDDMGVMKASILSSSDNAVVDNTIKLEDKSTDSPAKKRKIDLEQPPEDDSDDEVESSGNAHISTTSNMSERLDTPRDFLKKHACHENTVKSYPGTGLQPVEPYNAPNFSGNIVKEEQSLSNLSICNASRLDADVGTSKSNVILLPQPDLIDKASQEIKRERPWSFESSDAIMNPATISSRFSVQKTSPHLVLQEFPSNANIIHQGSPNLKLTHQHHKFPLVESVAGIVGECSKATQPEGTQKESLFRSPEKFQDVSRWFAKESFSRGRQLSNLTPEARFETMVSEGVHAMPNSVAPVITTANSQGQSTKHNSALWSSQTTIPQQPVFQLQVFPSVNRTVWLQSSQNLHNSLYPQQMVFGAHSPNSSTLPTTQGDITGPWNMIGLGQYYSSIPSIPQKPPFKKPPKLVLKNDGVAMGSKLLPPELSESSSQKKPAVNPSKKGLPQESQEKQGIETQEGGLKHDERLRSSGGQTLSCVGDAGERPLEPKVLATAHQDSIVPRSSPTTLEAIGGDHIISASPDEPEGKLSLSRPETIMRTEEKMLEQSLPRLLVVKEALISTEPRKNLPGVTLPGQASRLLRTEDDIEGCNNIKSLDRNNIEHLHFSASSRMLEDSKTAVLKVLIGAENVNNKADDMVMRSKAESNGAKPQAACLKRMEESDIVVHSHEKRKENVDANEHKLLKASHSVLAESPGRNGTLTKDFSSSNPLSPSSQQPMMQVVSMQSTSMGAPSVLKREKRLIALENSLPHGRSSSANMSKPATPTSDRDCLSTPSLTSLMSESKPDAIGTISSSEDLHADSDSDNLAATILLSFAPILDLQVAEKRSKENAVSSNRKRRSGEHASSQTRQLDNMRSIRSETPNSKHGQGHRVQVHGSSRRRDFVERIKPTTKDRLRGEHKFSKLNCGGAEVLKVKLPRVMAVGSLNDEVIPISESKQLNKLDGPVVSSKSACPLDHTKPHKDKDLFPTHTGRRSCRGLPMAARTHTESKMRPQQHCADDVNASSRMGMSSRSR